MDLWHITLLAIVQGLTEFLPISSSAHLVMVPLVLNWPDQGLAFDVAVHVGSLIAVLLYFRVEVRHMLKAWILSLSGNRKTNDSILAWWILFGTLPAVFIGYLFFDLIQTDLRSPWVIAVTTISFGLLLLVADKSSTRDRTEYDLNLRDVLIIGCFQIMALVPGTSRSGVTITAGLLLGMSRRAAARFSFLLSMPIIFASGVLHSLELTRSSQSIDWWALVLAVILSAMSAGLCIHYFLKLIERVGMLPFVVYRLILGGILIVLLL